jgi:hypothetical protein
MTRAALVNNIECGWRFLTYITERERERERERVRSFTRNAIREDDREKEKIVRGMKPGSRNSQNSHH